MFDMLKRYNKGSSYKAISAREPDGIIAEQYRKLRTNIEMSSFNKNYTTITITSTLGGEGKTTTCVNLATVYSQSQKKTLLIDLDLRKPKIHRGFELVNENGISDIIMDEVEIEQAVKKITPYLYVLPSGTKVPFSSELISSDKFKEVLEKLKTMYDKIIIDTPPLGAVTDATIIGSLSDATILTTASRKTHADAVQSSVQSLKDNKVNLIGSILTHVKKRDQRYLSNYYYNYREN